MSQGYDPQFIDKLRTACEDMGESNPAFTNINLRIILQQFRHEQAAHAPRAKAQDLLADQMRTNELKGNIFAKEEDDDYENAGLPDNFVDVVAPNEKFKVLSKNKKGDRVYRITDFYLAHNAVVESIYKRRIGQVLEQERKRRREDYTLQQNLDSTLTKFLQAVHQGQTEDAFRQQKKMTLEQLEQTIGEMGQSRRNFFLHLKHNHQKMPKVMPKSNPHLANPRFISSLKKVIARASQKQFQPQMDCEDKLTLQSPAAQPQPIQTQLVYDDNLMLQDIGLGIVHHRNNVRQPPAPQYEDPPKNLCWGQQYVPKLRKFRFVLEQEQQKLNQLNCNLLEEGLSKFNYYNKELAGSWLKPLQQYKRLQIDLNAPGMRLQKLQNLIRKQKEQFQIPPPEKDKPKNSGRGVRKKLEQKKKQNSQAFQAESHLTNQRVGLGKDSTTEQSLMDMLIDLKNNQKDPSSVSHSQVARRLVFVKFVIDALEFKDFHRHSFHQQEPTSQLQFVRVPPRKNRISGLKINHEAIDSFQKFRTETTLSAKEGTVVLTQQIEENPLMLCDPGMCSKMVMHVDYKRMASQVANRALRKPPMEDIEGKRGADLLYGEEGAALFREQLIQRFGTLGALYLQEHGKVGLLGHSDGVGASVLQNKMYGQVAVKQQMPSRDFLLVRTHQGKWIIRRFDHLYLNGQIQPKMDFFSPDSRSISSFLTNYLRSFIKLTFERQSSLHFETLRDTFRTINEHNIRKTLKSIGADSSDSRIYIAPAKVEKELDVTPEEVCLYQKMQNTLYQFKLKGIQLLRVPDKLKQIVSVHLKKHPDDLRKYALAKFICDQLHLCPWYLTQSYKSSQQGQGKLELRGYGDPTKGHGGISFIKRPQKKRVEKEEEPEEDRGKGVTGTNADLRKLKNDIAQRMLLEQGISNQEVVNMNRWEKVNTLKEIASRSNNQLLLKFKREQRATKKMKKEAYQKDIDQMFNTLIKNLNLQEVEDCLGQPLCPITFQQYMQIEREDWESKKRKMRSKPSSKEQHFEDSAQDDSEQDDLD